MPNNVPRTNAINNVSIPFSNSYAALPARFFVRQNPGPVRAPALIRLNTSLCKLLGLDPDTLSSNLGADVFAGNVVPCGAEPIAQAYAGHQFGGWVSQLGDGRAVLLGEVVGTDGVRRDIQLKGSGRTPFSRGGDGRAALGPVLREYIVSEAMHALGVPTTRALAAVTTGEEVIRDGFRPGAVLTRVAQSHVRVGTFEYFASRHDEDAIRRLADYVIDRHYPDAKKTENPYASLLTAVVTRQADLVAKWFGLGFIHGVMNTDNTSVAGETIDYGPCAFMDTYHPQKVFSSIDHMGRYAFANQPSIIQWNLAQLAQWCCQTNPNRSPKLLATLLSRRQLTPLGQRGRAVLLVDGAAVEMTVEIEVVEGRSVHCGKLLQRLDVPEFRHRAFPSTKRLV